MEARAPQYHIRQGPFVLDAVDHEWHHINEYMDGWARADRERRGIHIPEDRPVREDDSDDGERNISCGWGADGPC